jgi:hypothetical protein
VIRHGLRPPNALTILSRLMPILASICPHALPTKAIPFARNTNDASMCQITRYVSATTGENPGLEIMIWHVVSARRSTENIKSP